MYLKKKSIRVLILYSLYVGCQYNNIYGMMSIRKIIDIHNEKTKGHEDVISDENHIKNIKLYRYIFMGIIYIYVCVCVCVCVCVFINASVNHRFYW
jgi:hypothetical protein